MQEFHDADVYLYLEDKSKKRVIIGTSGEMDDDAGRLWRGWFAATKTPCELKPGDCCLLTLESGKEYFVEVRNFEEIEDCDKEIAVNFTGLRY